MTLTFGKKVLPKGLNVCINYEFNLLDHVGVVAKAGSVWRLDKINMAAIASFSVKHENGQYEYSRRHRRPIYTKFQSTTVNCKKNILKLKKIGEMQ